MNKKLLGEIELNRIYQRDCIEGMRMIPDKSVDMILCDLPYGTTACKWDTVIPFEPLWAEYVRVIKDNGAIVLTAGQPFTSALIMSNPKLFKYSLVWDKVGVSNPMLAKKQFMRSHEDVVVFYKKQPTYNPQMTEGKKWSRGGKIRHTTDSIGESTTLIRGSSDSELRYPKSILTFSNADKTKNVHPTQKPVSLFEYLIKTFTNEGDVILDNCMGSGTTAIACVRNNRNFIGFELEREYVEIANMRLDSEVSAD